MRNVKLVITVGLPGSGKSTYLARLGVNAISSDEVRRLLTDNPEDQPNNRRVFAIIRYLVEQRLQIARPVTYVDATHLKRWEREPYVEIARRYGCELEALYFDVPVEICMNRNRERHRVVPTEAILTMQAGFEPPTSEEGFTTISRVQNYVGQGPDLPTEF